MMRKLEGMPAVPEGHFWRITGGGNATYMRLQLRKKLWFGSYCVNWVGFLITNDATETAFNLNEAATYVINNYWKDTRRNEHKGDLRGDFIS